MMVTRGDATTMNLLMHPLQGTRVDSHTVGRGDTHESEDASTDALRQISSHSCLNKLKLVPPQC